MRVNQEDRPGVSNLPPPEIKNKVEKLTKRKLKNVLKAILSIKKSIYQPLRIKPRSSYIILPNNIINIFSFSLFSLFVTP